MSFHNYVSIYSNMPLAICRIQSFTINVILKSPGLTNGQHKFNGPSYASYLGFGTKTEQKGQQSYCVTFEPRPDPCGGGARAGGKALIGRPSAPRMAADWLLGRAPMTGDQSEAAATKPAAGLESFARANSSKSVATVDSFVLD